MEAHERLLDHLRRAETLAQTLGDPLRLGRVYAELGNNFWVAGEVDRAIVYGQRALALAATLGHVGLQARTHLSLGYAYYDAGDYARAVESLRRNVATLQGNLLYERFGSNEIIAAISRTWLSLCHAECGAFTEGLAMAAEGLRIAETVNHPLSLILAYYGLSVVYLRQGDVHRAIPGLERAMGLCEDWHIPFLLPRQAAALGVAYALDGRIAAGLALVDQQRGNQAWALWLLGESTARHASPEVEPAAGHYRQALALAEELGMRPLQAHCHRGLGTLYARQGQQEQARAALASAIAMYRDMEMTFWLPQAEAVLAQVG